MHFSEGAASHSCGGTVGWTGLGTGLGGSRTVMPPSVDDQLPARLPAVRDRPSFLAEECAQMHLARGALRLDVQIVSDLDQPARRRLAPVVRGDLTIIGILLG